MLVVNFLLRRIVCLLEHAEVNWVRLGSQELAYKTMLMKAVARHGGNADV